MFNVNHDPHQTKVSSSATVCTANAWTHMVDVVDHVLTLCKTEPDEHIW